MQFLYDYHSIPMCLSVSDRHMRLTRQIPGGAKYESAVHPIYDELQTKYNELEAAKRNTSGAHDLIRLHDKLLDDLLIRLNHNCSDYDKQNTGSFTLTTLFPNGNYGEIIRMNMYKEPVKALELAEKIISFGSTHPLYPFAAELQTSVEASTKAIKDEEEVIKAEGLAKANAEIAKLKLIRRYNSNYHQAADESGKAFAERLFPDLITHDKDDESQEGDQKDK